MPTPPPRPDGRAAVISTFGDITKFIKTDGTLSAKWEEQMIRRIKLPQPLSLSGAPGVQVTRVTVHKLLTELLRDTLEAIHTAGKWPALKPYGGGFIFRPKRTTNEISLHSWGIAWDFDPGDNKQGTTGTMDPQVVQIFEAHGFFWGGKFKGTKDPMHFQYAINT